MRRKRQSNRRLRSQWDDFDRDILIGNAASDRQENVVVNEGTVDQEFAINNTSSTLTTNENFMSVKTFKRCFNEGIDREMWNIVDTVEDRIQNAILTAIGSDFTPKIELAVRSKNASIERDANSELGERIGITPFFENVFERNNTLHLLNTNDETRNNIPDEVSE